MWMASIPGSVAGAVAEFWYFGDYWSPPLLAGVGEISPEDFLFGFAIAGVSVAIEDVLLGTRNAHIGPRRMSAFFTVIAANVAALAVFSTMLGYNSVLVSEAMFLASAGVIVTVRRDLFLPTLRSGVLTIAVVLPAYVLLFYWLFPDYWYTHWIMASAFWRSVMILHIPLVEILWYFSWGCLAAALVNCTAGTRKVTVR
jgi:hypothetical protein